MSAYEMMDRWTPSYRKCKPGMKKKRLTLYACYSKTCEGGTQNIQKVKGFKVTYEKFKCHLCNGTGIIKRTVSVYEKDYKEKMKMDREKAGMKYRG